MENITASLACCCLVILFVFSLYVPGLGLPRNHPRTVRRRIYATAIVCGVGPGMLYFLLDFSEQLTLSTFLGLLGIRWTGVLTAALFPCVLILLLYTGCLVQLVLEEEKTWTDIRLKRKDLILRDYFVAPIAEELIFRACMLMVLLSAFEKYRAISVCPLFFGLAHMHHLIEWFRAKNGSSFSQACCTILLQVVYTSIFGLFAAFVFVRTQHLLGIVLSHSLCNMMGLPPIEDALQHPKKCYIMSSYVIGVILFVFLLFPLTEPLMYSEQIWCVYIYTPRISRL